MEVASTGGEDPLLGLPVEVWFHVMAFLEAKDALPLSTVCRTWHDILFSQGSWVWATWYRQEFPDSHAKPRTPARWKNLFLLRLRERHIKTAENAEGGEHHPEAPLFRPSNLGLYCG